jgi:hypothetical protein
MVEKFQKQFIGFAASDMCCGVTLIKVVKNNTTYYFTVYFSAHSVERTPLSSLLHLFGYPCPNSFFVIKD